MVRHWQGDPCNVQQYLGKLSNSSKGHLDLEKILTLRYII